MIYFKNDLLIIHNTVTIQHCMFSDRTQEGMRELEQLRDKRDVNLCSVMALMLGHKKAKVVGMEPLHLSQLCIYVLEESNNLLKKCDI